MKLTEQTRQRVRSDFKHGKTIPELGALYNLSRMSVYRALGDLVKRNPPKPKPPPPVPIYDRLCAEFTIDLTKDHLRVTGLPFKRRLKSGYVHWFLPVQCVCGKDLATSVGHFRSGNRSCGCKRIERIASLNRTHDFKHDLVLSRLRAVHQAILHRTYGPGEACAEWRDQAAFFRWALANGYEPGLSIDRIDNAIGYRPSNCRIVDDLTNANNRASSQRYSFNGRQMTLAEICRATSTPYRTVQQRIRAYGWSLERARIAATIARALRCRVYIDEAHHGKKDHAKMVGVVVTRFLRSKDLRFLRSKDLRFLVVWHPWLRWDQCGIVKVPTIWSFYSTSVMAEKLGSKSCVALELHKCRFTAPCQTLRISRKLIDAAPLPDNEIYFRDLRKLVAGPFRALGS